MLQKFRGLFKYELAWRAFIILQCVGILTITYLEIRVWNWSIFPEFPRNRWENLRWDLFNSSHWKRTTNNWIALLSIFGPLFFSKALDWLLSSKTSSDSTTEEEFSKRIDSILELQSKISECTEQVAEKWVQYNSIFKFKENTPLSDIIGTFSIPMQEFIQNQYPGLLLEEDDEFLLYLISSAIISSGSHSKEDVDSAISDLINKGEI